MALPRVLNQLICRVLIGVFMFAQMAVAGYACPKPLQARDQAMSIPADCSQMEQIDPQAANLCAEHCKFGHQSSDTASVAPLAAAAAALLYALPEGDIADLSAGASVPAPDPLLAAAPPPHAILHCVLRI
jgi:hypothetical protein